MYSLIQSGNLKPSVKQEQTQVSTDGASQDLIYTIKSGDSIGTISQQTTGTAKNTKQILDHNQITDPKNLKVGQTIKIPQQLLPEKK
jgi:nucleoid-associated protein YgaU